MLQNIIGVISGKGGVGKTVVSINLAASLCKNYRKKVLLVDANITTPHVGLYLGLYSTPVTLNDVLKGTVDVKKTIYEHSSGLHVMPASLKLDDLKNMDWGDLKEKLKLVFDEYDFIIMDSSPGFNRESLITLENCSEAIFVTNPVVHSAADLIKCRECCESLNVKHPGIIVNMIRNKKHELSGEEIEQLIEMKIIGSVHFNDRIMESLVSKTPAVLLDKKVDAEFGRISAYIMGDEYIEKRPILARIFGMFSL